MTKQYISNKTKLLCKRNKRNTHNTHRNKRMFTRRSTRIKKYNIQTQKAGAHQFADSLNTRQLKTFNELKEHNINKNIIREVIAKLEDMLATNQNSLVSDRARQAQQITNYNTFMDTFLNITKKQCDDMKNALVIHGRRILIKILSTLINDHQPGMDVAPPSPSPPPVPVLRVPMLPPVPVRRVLHVPPHSHRRSVPPPPVPPTSVDLTHVWYRSWPDHEAPKVEEFKLFIDTLYNNIYKTDLFNFKEDDTIIIHCSAGVGRSGVVLIILQLMNQLEQNKKKIILDNIIERITIARNYRIWLVQSLEQFIFICNFFEINISDITTQTIEDLYNNIPKQSASQYTNEALSLGEAANRYTNILPYNINRVKLLKDKELNNYINASFMEPIMLYRDGVQLKIKIILAQGPKDKTVKDFLQMCIEQQVRLIIMLTSLTEGSQNKCADYMISADGSSDDMVARANTGIDGSLSYINKNADKQFVLYTKYILKESSSKYSSTCIKESEVSIPIRPTPTNIIYNNTPPSNASNLKNTSIYATVTPRSQRRPPDIPKRHYNINQTSLPQTSEIPQLLPQQEPQLSDLNKKTILAAKKKIQDMMQSKPERANVSNNLNYTNHAKIQKINKMKKENLKEFEAFVNELLKKNIITNEDHAKLLKLEFTRKGRFGLLQILTEITLMPSLPVQHMPVHVPTSLRRDVNSFQQQSVPLPLQPLTDLEKEKKHRQKRRDNEITKVKGVNLQHFLETHSPSLPVRMSPSVLDITLNNHLHESNSNKSNKNTSNGIGNVNV